MFRVKAIFAAFSLATIANFTGTAPVLAQGYDRPISWTGFYMGAHGGYAWSDIEFPGAPPHPAGPPRQSLDGGIVGLQIGYNYQINNLVVGVEADLSKGNLTGTARDGNYITQTDTIDMTGSVRARIGYAVGSFLPYLTAGIMWDRGERGQQCPAPAAVVSGHCNAANGFSPYNLSQQQWHSGFVWGGGVEHAISRHWSFKLEGLVARMGEETYVLGPAANGKTANVSKIEHDTATVRLGINYRF